MSPLSQSQLGIFYACRESDDQANRNEGNYQVPVLFDLPDWVDLHRLKTALDTIIKTHPYILSRIVMQDDTLMMQSDDFSDDIVSIQSITGLDEVRPSFCRTMDLMHDRLFRLEIYQTPAGNYLYLDFHHIIIDGSAFGILMREIERAYTDGTTQGEDMTGDDIANEEFRLRCSDVWNTERDWYMKTFGDAPEVDSMPVPTDINNNPDGGLVETDFHLPVLRNTADTLCTRYHVSKSVIWLAAWGKLLANYTAEDRAYFASIYTGRGDKRTHQTLTMMVHTLPVFMHMPSAKPIGDWLRDVAEQQTLTREKNAYSYADIHQDLNVRSDILFAYHGKVVPTDVFSFTIDGIPILGHDLRIARPGITLDGQLLDTPNAEQNSDFTLRISYNSRCYSPQMIAEMAQSYAAILNSMSDAVTIGDLAASSLQQVQQLDGFNAESLQPCPCDQTVIDLFNRNVSAYPDNDCCVCSNVRLTYRQVGQITDQLARQIVQKVRASQSPDSDSHVPVVSFIVPRNEWMLLVPVAIAKAGYVYQPLDSSYPKERLNFMIQDADAALLIANQALRPLVDAFNGDTIIVTDPASVYADDTPTAPSVIRTPQPDDTFILLYTSGTTGTPKGVMLSQRNIAAILQHHVPNLHLNAASRCTAYASCGFDSYMLDLWAAMTAGAALHIISDDIRYDMVALHDYMVHEHITHAFMTTQVATQLAIEFPDIPTLEVLYTGGEKLVSIDPPHYRMINMYGPTETTAYVSWYDVTKNEKNIPIGHPTATTCLYVVNKDGKRVPIGAAGELWITGAQTGKGYLNQPDKTAAAFIDNPFSDGTAMLAKAYRTGDIVRYREDGAIEFIGRRDGQVKIRGFRIELKEVEAVIRDFANVRDVTVQAFDLEAGGKAIAAYVVSDAKIDINELNAFIMDQKPPYMVPAVTMQIDDIPLNVNGKVDKKRLPKPELTEDDHQTADAPAAPLNSLEEVLMDILTPLLNSKQFAITTPLQYVGLTSITGIKLSTQLFKRFSVTIPTKQLRSATLQSIENAILLSLLNPMKENNDDHTLRNDTAAIDDYPMVSPLSNAQQGVYYECLKDPMSTAYNIPNIVHFPASVTSAQLKQAVEAAIKAHPGMLVHFDNTSSDPKQVLDKGATPVVSLSDQTVDVLQQSFVRPFDLTAGPLYRAVVTGNTLLLDVHHLVMDGSSEIIFLRHVCQALEGHSITKETYTSLHHAIDEQQLDPSQAERFFEEQLQTIDEATSLPPDLHGNEQEGRPATIYQPVHHDRVEQFAGQLGVTPMAVYLAAVEYIAARYGNTKDVCLCTVSSGRSNLKIADTVGMFVNTIALAAHITDDTVTHYIRQVSDSVNGSLDHEYYPFAKVSDRFNIGAELAFVYQIGVVEIMTVNRQPVTLEPMALSKPKFKVTILVEPHDGQVCLAAEYNDQLYSTDMMSRMLESLHQVIENMIAYPTSPVTSLSIMSNHQQSEVARMNSIGAAPLPIRLFHRGMEQWAQRTPDRLAVIATDKSLTYDAFDKAANGVAHALMKRGIQKGDPVVVLLPRYSSTIVCIVGIMKAGGAFIPCDPDYPTERIQLIAQDSGAPYVVTTRDLLPNYGERGLVIDDLMAEPDTTPPQVDVLPTDLAYLIYTSGSTGKPKGVRVAHYNITTFITSGPLHPMRVMMETCERLLSVATISFDASISEYGMALFNGRTFVFANEEETKDPIALLHLIERTQPDYFGCTGSRMLQYMEMPAFCDRMKHFKCILQGGEKFSEILLERIRQVNDQCVILNGYGPTEISIGCNCVDLQHAQHLTVGKPLPNYTEWVIDKDENELPVGVTGELCVGGDGVTQGYNNLPDLTKAKYITYRGMRAFKTGDYARWLPNGEIEILGRTDNQVKLRGLRIELGEVENAIAQVNGVKNVLVKISTIKGRDHLSAYYVADRRIDTVEMKQTISRTLTAYMVPTAFLQMDSFPLTPNGKVDYRHLPEPQLAQADGVYVAPTNASEQFFADTFARILNLDKVGATDSFFDLGGTSLVVMKVVICAQQSGYPVTYADVFANPTPRLLALLTNPSSHSDDDPDADIKDYDYTAINRLLATNTLDSFRHDTALRPLEKVMLTGATGFLGIHILKCLVEDYPATVIHCINRSKHGITAEERLRQLLFYYFEKDYADLFGKRIVVHEGDVTAPITLDEPVDTVINCAALVKHFAKGNEIEEVNVGSVRNCIDFCLQHGARLIQVSTYSVAGSVVNNEPDIQSYSEQMLYVGQRIHNQYIHSKLNGERLLLEAVVNRGLDAKIMRVGNLSARTKDGEFQINLNSNSFMGRLRVYQMLGVSPYSAYRTNVEFSPIDETAAAICLLARTNNHCVVFHPYNSHQQMIGDILDEMKTIGRHIQLVEDDRFLSILNAAKADPNKQEKLSAILAYENKQSWEIIRAIPAINDYTIQVLLRLGFRWNPTTWDYMDRFLKQINGLLFFDNE